jgi:hypothetical protein
LASAGGKSLIAPPLSAVRYSYTYHLFVEDNKSVIAHNTVQHLIDYAAVLEPKLLKRQIGQFFESCLLYGGGLLCSK